MRVVDSTMITLQTRSIWAQVPHLAKRDPPPRPRMQCHHTRQTGPADQLYKTAIPLPHTLQGESDAYQLSTATTYQRNFRTFVQSLRQAVQPCSVQLPIITAVMSTTNRVSNISFIVRQQQLANDPLLPGIFKVDMEVRDP